MAANPREESRVVRTISSLMHAAKATKLDGPSVCPYDLCGPIAADNAMFDANLLPFEAPGSSSPTLVLFIPR